MKVTIDGKEIEAREGQSILEAALEADIFIPHLCSHPDLEAKGGCRLCSVEIEGMEDPVPSCMTKAEEGMKITVNGPNANCSLCTSIWAWDRSVGEKKREVWQMMRAIL